MCVIGKIKFSSFYCAVNNCLIYWISKCNIKECENIYNNDDLNKDSICSKMEQVEKEGNGETLRNIIMIISIKIVC